MGEDPRSQARIWGYLPLDRVSLVRPLLGTDRPVGVVGDLDSPIVPVPLVVSQTAEATYQGEGQPTLAEAARWTYGLTYSHEHAEQDDVLLAVTLMWTCLKATPTTSASASTTSRAAAISQRWS